jgi:hypothetical protein
MPREPKPSPRSYRYIAAHKAGWKSAVHRRQWQNKIDQYAKPILGAVPRSAIDTAAVMRVLQPIWQQKPETASRLRGRIEAILNAAKVEGFRSGENPVMWRGSRSSAAGQAQDPPREESSRCPMVGAAGND